MIATYPVGGVVWDYGHYLLGLERLGWEVYYLEDTGAKTYDPRCREYVSDCSFGVNFLRNSLATLSPVLGERWHFRSEDGTCYGMHRMRLETIVAGADLFLNVSGGTLLRDPYMKNGCKVLIDTDPGWNHFVNYPKWDNNPGWQGSHGYRSHDYFFTYAERLGRPDCPLPDLGITWHATRPPVAVDRWKPLPPGRTWTTVMTWNNFREAVRYHGRVYGTKEMEFEKVEELPARIEGVPFALAVGGSEPPVRRWRERRWRVIDSHSVSATLDQYRDYIQASRGELSVAKNLYTATRCGWFSCRSVCYLAASRPVVVQETGFSDVIPTGQGLFAFSDEVEARAGIEAVENDYARHQHAARALALEYFEASRVIGKMLETIGLR